MSVINLSNTSVNLSGSVNASPQGILSQGLWSSTYSTAMAPGDLTLYQNNILTTATEHKNDLVLNNRSDIIFDGVSLRDTLLKIQDRLALLTPDPSLEAEWAELKSLGDQYRSLEAEIQEKLKAWRILEKK